MGEAVAGRGIGELGVLGADGGQAQLPAGAVDGEHGRLLGEARAHRAAPAVRAS